MAGNTPKQAVDNFLLPIRQAVSCITNSIIISGFNPKGNSPHALTLQNGDAVRLTATPVLNLVLQMQYQVVQAGDNRGPWKVTTWGYNYSVLDKSQKEIVGYHWHPWMPPAYPHIHVMPASGATSLRKIHLPTGRISIESVLRLLIEQFHVQAIRGDWDKVLKRTQTAYEKFRTWS